jgi:hypothetical protein
MATVTIHPPKTPVTKGCNSVSAATTPNVCKMPGPPAPFVPTPLPNIGRSNIRPKGYSTSVKFEGHSVAIAGASFGSLGDVASKGTGGGIVSMNVEGPTKFISPGSLTVKVEGKNVHLLSDVMSNNNGPSGSPPNAATLAGTVHAMATAGGATPKKIDCQKGPPSGPLTECEKEEVCNKCGELNANAKDLQKPPRAQYEKNRKLGSAEATKLVKAAQADPQAGKNMLKFQATSQKCKDEHVANGFKGSSADHIHDIGLGGHPSNSNNLKWMSSKANSWMGSIMGQYKPDEHTGVEPNCC